MYHIIWCIIDMLRVAYMRNCLALQLLPREAVLQGIRLLILEFLVLIDRVSNEC